MISQKPRAEYRPVKGVPGICWGNDKLVFGGFASKLPVIANQRARWCGNPPAPWNQVTITTKNRKVSLLCRAIVDTFYL